MQEDEEVLEAEEVQEDAEEDQQEDVEEEIRRNPEVDPATPRVAVEDPLRIHLMELLGLGTSHYSAPIRDHPEHWMVRAR